MIVAVDGCWRGYRQQEKVLGELHAIRAYLEI